MNSDQYLNPSAIKRQCEASVNILERDNLSLEISEKSINSFINDSEIKAEAFDNLKQQMNDYITISLALKSANNVDIQDFNTLSNSVGEQLLDGQRIVQGMTNAEDSKQRNNERAASNRELCRMYAGVCPVASMYYKFVPEWYDLMAYWDQKEYEKWLEKSTVYDETEARTCGLFQSGIAIRKAADTGLQYVGKAFVDGAYVPDIKSEWRGMLNDIVLNSISEEVLSEEISITQEELNDMSEVQRADFMQKAVKYFFICNPDLSPEPGQEYSIVVSPDIVVTYKTSVQAVADIGDSQVNSELGGTETEIEVSNGKSTIKTKIDHQKKELGEMGLEAVITENKLGSTSATISGEGGKVYGGVKYTNRYGSECTVQVGGSFISNSYKYTVSGVADNMKVESSIEITRNNRQGPGSGYEPVKEPSYEFEGEKVAEAVGVTATVAVAGYITYRIVKGIIAVGGTALTGGAAAPVLVPFAIAP